MSYPDIKDIPHLISSSTEETRLRVTTLASSLYERDFSALSSGEGGWDLLSLSEQAPWLARSFALSGIFDAINSAVPKYSTPKG